MKTDRNKNNVKSEENMILEKSRRSDANVFPVENKGKGKIAKAKKRQVKGVIWKTVLQQKWLSMGIVFAVAGAVVTALIPPLILAKIVDTVTTGKAVTFWVIFLYFAMLVVAVVKSFHAGLGLLHRHSADSQAVHRGPGDELSGIVRQRSHAKCRGQRRSRQQASNCLSHFHHVN